MKIGRGMYRGSLILALAAGALALVGWPGGSGTAAAPKDQAPRYVMYYWDQPRELTLDTSRIAMLSDKAAAVNPNDPLFAQLGVGNFDSVTVPITGWTLADTPANARTEEEVEQLVGQLAAANVAAYVSPVFFDNFGGPLLIVRDIIVGFDQAVAAKKGEQILVDSNAGVIIDRNYAQMPNVYRLRSASRNGFEVLAAANALAALPETRWAEPDTIFTGHSLGTCTQVIPNDPFFPRCLWGLHNTGNVSCCTTAVPVADMDMDAPEAWCNTLGSPEICVAIIDVGVQVDHPDLNLKVGTDVTNAPCGSGNPCNACDHHGTAVAGCVSAHDNNALGVVGVAPNCTSYSVRTFISSLACDGSWSSNAQWTVDALTAAENNGCRVSNNSNAYGFTSAAIEAKYDSTRANGMVHFASAGNSGAGSLAYPASIPSVNAVAALDANGDKAAFSQFGPGLDFSAPGVGVATTDRTGAPGYVAGDYVCVNGTSFASPYAAGVAALILSVDPSLTAAQVESIMAKSAVDRGAAGYDTTYGWGFVNAKAALDNLKQDCPGRINFGVTPDDFGDPHVCNADGTPIVITTQYVFTQSIVFGTAVDKCPDVPPVGILTDGACAPSCRSSGLTAFTTDWWCQFKLAQVPGQPVENAGVEQFSAELCFINANPGTVLMEGFNNDCVRIVSASNTQMGSEVLTIVAPIGELIAMVRVVSSAPARPGGLSIDCLEYPDPVRKSPCGDPDAGSCLAAHPTPGCNDEACCEQVCQQDPFCCDTAWDQICADEAANKCVPDTNFYPDEAQFLDALRLSGKDLKAREDFEEANIGPGGIAGMDDPLDRFTNNGFFSPGDILYNLRFQSNTNNTGGVDDPGVDGQFPRGAEGLVVLGAGALGLPNKAIAANFFEDSLDILSLNPNHTAIGMNIAVAGFGNCEGAFVEVRVFDKNDVLMGAFFLQTGVNGRFLGLLIKNRDTFGRINLHTSAESCGPVLLDLFAYYNTKCPADCVPPGGDGIVNVSDLLGVIGGWGPGGGYGPCDIVPPLGDGVVNVSDLLEVIAEWGPCPPANCQNPFDCGQTPLTSCPSPDPNCWCWTGTDGGGVCAQDALCADLARCFDGNCPPGTVCAVNTCCGEPVCLPICGGGGGGQDAEAKPGTLRASGVVP